MTAAVIEFLTNSGSDFGTQPHDIEALRSVDALAGEFRLRLETLPLEPTKGAKATATGEDTPQRRHLHHCLQEGDLKEVDWPQVMQELRTRLRLTDGFFAQDLPASETSA